MSSSADSMDATMESYALSSSHVLPCGTPVLCLCRPPGAGGRRHLFVGTEGGYVHALLSPGGGSDRGGETTTNPYRHPHAVLSVAASESTGTYATGCKDGGVRLFAVPAADGAFGPPLSVLAGHGGRPAGSVRFAGASLVSGGWDGTFKVWSGDGPSECVQTVAEGLENTVAVLPDGDA